MTGNQNSSNEKKQNKSKSKGLTFKTSHKTSHQLVKKDNPSGSNDTILTAQQAQEMDAPNKTNTAPHSNLLNANIIDFSQYKKNKYIPPKPTDDVPGALVDMTERRENILQQERRMVKRTILQEFIGAFAVLPYKGLMKVAIHDISDTGLAFDMEAREGHLNLNEEVAFRIYLNKETFFPFVIKITNIRSLPDQDLVRHGAQFTAGTVNDIAMHHFVRFIESVSACLRSDKGDLIVSHK